MPKPNFVLTRCNSKESAVLIDATNLGIRGEDNDSVCIEEIKRLENEDKVNFRLKEAKLMGVKL